MIGLIGVKKKISKLNVRISDIHDTPSVFSIETLKMNLPIWEQHQQHSYVSKYGQQNDNPRTSA